MRKNQDETPKSGIYTQGLKPKHHRGQNFLIDKNIVNKIIAAAQLTKNDTVVEVGAGNGTLTKLLATHAKSLTAVEIDKDLIPVLESELTPFSNVRLIKDDIMALAIDDLLPTNTKDSGYKVVANIPYSITSSIIRKFLTESPRPSELILLIQKEVAQRIARSEDSSLLSLSVLYYAKPSILFNVSKNSFWPKPKVDSAVIKIELLPSEQLPTRAEEEWFFKVLHAGFAAKRKLLASNLAKGLDIPGMKVLEIFAELKIQPKIRAEEVKIETWKKLAEKLAEF